MGCGRGRGRPRKDSTAATVTDTNSRRRGPGRPRKNFNTAITTVTSRRRGPGRAGMNSATATATVTADNDKINNSVQSIIEYLPQNLIRKRRSKALSHPSGFRVEEAVKKTGIWGAQIADSKPTLLIMNPVDSVTSNSLSNKGSSQQSFENESKRTRESDKDMMELDSNLFLDIPEFESNLTDFQSDFFQDMPEVDELPINFEIPGPIPDLVDLYSFSWRRK